MNFKHSYSLPEHLQEEDGLPRSRDERLLWIKRRVESGYYNSDRVIRAVADAFMEPADARRAGERTWRGFGESGG